MLDSEGSSLLKWPMIPFWGKTSRLLLQLILVLVGCNQLT